MRELIQDKGTLAILNNENTLLSFATGVGKSKSYIDALNKMDNIESIWVVVYVNTTEEDLRKEYEKWELKWLDKVNFINYKSVHKVPKDIDVLVLEEAHHITDKVLEDLKDIQCKKRIYISATVNYVQHKLLLALGKYKKINYPLKDAIGDSVLPKPNIMVVPVYLDTTTRDRTYKHVKYKTWSTIRVSFPEWNSKLKYDKSKVNYDIVCTEKEYYSILEDKINYLDKLLMSSRIEISDLEALIRANRDNGFDTSSLEKEVRTKKKAVEWPTKNRMMIGSHRKRFLSSVKLEALFKLKEEIIDEYEKIIFFCDSKETTERLGNAYHSGNKEDHNYNLYLKFLNGDITYLSTIRQFNETKNIPGIQCGVLQEMDKVTRSTIQRMGRILRCENPDIYILTVIGTDDDKKLNTLLEIIGNDDFTTLDNENDN